jgi:hypothetical protein
MKFKELKEDIGYFFKNAVPFFIMNELTSDLDDRDWQNPFIVFLMPFVVPFVMLDVLILPIVTPIWLIRLLIQKLRK